MRIGIDLHTVTDFMQGTRTYIINLVKYLLHIDKKNKYYLYINRKNESIVQHFAQENVLFRHIVPRNRLIRIPISFPVRLAVDSIDVFHCQYMGLPLGRTPYVVMMHDIIHEYLPQFYPKTLCFFMRMFYPMSARRANRVLTVSEHSKRDIVKFYKIPEEKIIVTYDAVSEDFYPITAIDIIKATLMRYGINGKYILFVGRLEPRKNAVRLIKAYHELRKTGKIEHKLVVVGMKDFKYNKILKAVRDLNLCGEVIFTGRIEDDDLPIFYNGASLFVYPTIAEGFGIPPLEAMACGIPVISSNTTSLPEVIGDAGILIDPYNIEDIARAIFDVLSNQDLQEKMKYKGLKRAKRFSWENTALKTLEVYQAIFEENQTKN